MGKALWDVMEWQAESRDGMRIIWSGLSRATHAFNPRTQRQRQASSRTSRTNYIEKLCLKKILFFFIHES